MFKDFSLNVNDKARTNNNFTIKTFIVTIGLTVTTPAINFLQFENLYFSLTAKIC
jgi:hypothetical protein